jgi:DNA-damage-inducible protein J
VIIISLTSISVKIDKELKAEADRLFNALGIPLSTAMNIFIRQAVQKQAIPFEIALDEKAQFNALLSSMRAKASRHGYMSDDEINNEINAARLEKESMNEKITLDSINADIASLS